MPAATYPIGIPNIIKNGKNNIINTIIQKAYKKNSTANVKPININKIININNGVSITIGLHI